MEADTLKQRVRDAPTTPGVYTWRGARGRVLYVGKAVNLRSRLLSYLRAKDSRIETMVRESTRVEWESVPTEIEALIRESHRIKLQKPKYNIVMRDDKQYSYVGITDEQFPQFMVTHQATSPHTKKTFQRVIGPFTDATALKSTLRWLRRAFPYCTCKQTHHVKCLNAHIGACFGFCCIKTPASATQKKTYRASIRAITSILEGRSDALIRQLEVRMKKAGAAHRLEDALEMRTQRDRIRRVFENAQIISARKKMTGLHTGALEQLTTELGLAGAVHRIEGYDVAHHQGAHPSGAMVVFIDGMRDASRYRLFNLSPQSVGDTHQLREVISRRLQHSEWPLPDLIIVDGGRAQLNTIARALDSAHVDIPVIAITKNDRHQADHVLSSIDAQVRMLTSMPRPARDLLVHIDIEAHRFSIEHHRRRHRRGMVE